MHNKLYGTFETGIVDNLEPESIPAGSAASSLSFVTAGDRTELRRGYMRIGSDRGAGRVTGLHVGERADGTSLLLSSYGKKVSYYDVDTEDWIEVKDLSNNGDILGTAGDGEEVAFTPYVTTHGYQTWFGSPNTGPFKLMNGSPQTAKDNYTDYHLRPKISENRTFGFGRDLDRSALYLSYIDALNTNAVTAEAVGTGNGVATHFTYSLSTITGVKTAFALVIKVTAAAVARDDNDGGIIASGATAVTGTINYSTGALLLDFTVPPANLAAITIDYEWEDATDEGVADFSFSGTRLAGEGDIIRQDNGGDLQNVMAFASINYCMHRRNAWQFVTTIDDRDASNDIFREGTGIPNWRACVPTGDGVWYIDDATENTPRVRLLAYGSSNQVMPREKSVNIDLSGYLFDRCAAIEWGDYVLFSMRTTDSSDNNRVLMLDRKLGSIDIMELYVSCFAIWDGSLVAGDITTNNVYLLFSGVDDDGANIGGNWKGWLTDLESSDRLKKVKDFVVRGNIGPDQHVNVYAHYDKSGRTLIGTIDGDAAYVDSGESVAIGAVTIGRAVIGGGSGGISAYNYEATFKMRSPKFRHVQIEFEPTGLGWFDFSNLEFQDIRDKGGKIPRRFRDAVAEE